MAYTTIDKPTDYFNTKLTTGTGSSQAVTGLGFQPDWIWGKRRDSSGNHSLFDSVRGITKGLETNNTGAEFTSTDYYSSFDSDGFTIASGGGGAGNGSGQTAVQWNWLASNTTASNTDGSISSTVSANTTSGFSIVSYTGTGSSATVGHGLGVAPKMIIVKNRSAVSGWKTWHSSLGAGDKVVELQDTGGVSTNASPFNSTVPTSSVFTIANFSYSDTNVSGQNFVAYCFAEKKGYSKFGSYEANNSTDGTFVYTGFKPALIILKAIDQAGDWFIFDNKRDIDNAVSQILYPNLSSSEGSASVLDFVSNGVKIRNSGSGGIN